MKTIFLSIILAFAVPSEAMVQSSNRVRATVIEVPHYVHIVSGQSGRINIWVLVWTTVLVFTWGSPIEP